MLSKVLKLLLPLTFVFACANAQWLKKMESSDNLYQEAKREIELKHYQKAISLCNKALDISPKNLDLQLLLGRAYSLAGKLDSARYRLNAVLEKNPKYRDAYIYLVNMEAVACNYFQAIEYADAGLKYFPNDRDLLLKKLDVYNKQGDWIESNKLADYLFDRYSSDPFIRSVYLDYKLTLARQYSHKGYIEIAKRAYESVLEQDPMNKEALQAIYNLDVRSGNYQSSLAFINRALQANPNSKEFLLKKVGILDEMSKFVEAIEVIRILEKLYPTDPEVRKLGTYMREQAARYYLNTDPYIQYQGILEKQPTNRDALNYVINIASSRGLYADALQYINAGLKKSPSDRDLLNKKLGILTSMKNYAGAAKLAENVYRENPNADNKENLIEIRLLSARDNIGMQEYDSAVADLNAVLKYDKANSAATNMLVNAYSAQKRYDDAIRTIDQALTYYPGNEGLLYKKAATLELYQRYADAAQISKTLLQKYPDKRNYLLSFVEQSLAAGRQSLAYDDYSSTTVILKEVLEKQPDNLDALNYLINIEAAFKQYDSALAYVDQALKYYPDSKDLLFKKASVYADAHRYPEAYAISGALNSEYPYNVRFRNAYIEHLQGSGKEYMTRNKPDSALREYYKALESFPEDSTTLFYAINILNDLKQYDTALALIARGRAAYPDKPYFLLKRAVVYENLGRWGDAYLTADTLQKLTNLSPQYIDYTYYLFSKRLKNSWGMGYLISKFDYTASINRLVMVQYTRYHKRGSVTARVNYAGRVTGAGFQFEAETYYNHRPRWTSYAVGSYSPNVPIFPDYRFGYSLSHVFGRGWDASIGARYLKVDSSTFTTLLGSLGKEIGEFSFDLRGYYIMMDAQNDPTNTIISEAAKQSNYYAAVLTTRCHVNPYTRADWISAIFGYGNAPDDFSRNFRLGQLLSFPTISIGAGYQKQLKYRTTLGIFGTWYNQKVSDKPITQQYLNQFDLYLQFLRKF